ncbi:haloacid dehalogenase family hydrolase domain-containing protein [Toxoplasma gondii GT1]|uniref:Haloacid dehalogenase family hydrolase domain-containing protein n=2 Tax=Toxoplasma gondii TaxID=5811 RepID=S7W5V6_TOXGG|nr:haloacid dehalogenase family hydrolase domain-containing protein [Toxoplasma gondii GT1]KAF4640183.1 haloacid dehalogenase family hydrolase domain-containing protein [Toxoplasma gondii]
MNRAVCTAAGVTRLPSVTAFPDFRLRLPLRVRSVRFIVFAVVTVFTFSVDPERSFWRVQNDRLVTHFLGHGHSSAKTLFALSPVLAHAITRETPRKTLEERHHVRAFSSHHAGRARHDEAELQPVSSKDSTARRTAAAHEESKAHNREGKGASEGFQGRSKVENDGQESPDSKNSGAPSAPSSQAKPERNYQTGFLGFFSGQCPATPLTTPIPPHFVRFVIICYSVIAGIAILWLLVQASRRKHHQRKQKQALQELVRHGELWHRSGKAVQRLSSGMRVATEGDPDEDNSLHSGPLTFVRGMLIQQEGCYRSLPGSMIKTVLKASFALACVLPILAISVSVVTHSNRSLTSFLMPPVFYDAQEPPAPPSNFRLGSESVKSSPSDSSRAIPKTRPPASLEGSSNDFITQYWISDVECMQTREEVCVSLMLFSFLYLALGQALWVRFLRDLDLTPAPLASCSQLRLRVTYIPLHRVEQLRRSWQREHRCHAAKTRSDELMRRRFTAVAASVTNVLSAEGAENSSQALERLGAGEACTSAVGHPGKATREGSEEGLEGKKDWTDGGMFVEEEDLTRWSMGEINLQSLQTQTFVADVWSTVSVQHRQRFVEVEGLSFVYASRTGVFVLATTFQEKQGVGEAVDLAEALTAEDMDGSEDKATRLLNTFQRVLLKPEEVADRQYIGKNRLVVANTTFRELVWSSVTGNAFYFAVLVAMWYYSFTRNFLVLGTLLVFVVFEGLYRIRLLVRQQKRLQSLAAEREKAVSAKPALVLRLLRTASGLKTGAEPRSATPPQSGQGSHSFVPTWIRIPAADIVPSDIVRLSRGDVVPCDMLLVNGTVAVDESSLRGDGTPQRKGPLRVSVRKLRGKLHGSDKGTPLPEDGRLADSVLHAGTSVISCTEARGRSRTLDEEAIQYVFTVEDETANRSAGKAFRETLGVEQRAKLEKNLATVAQTQVAAAEALMDAGASGQGGICWGVALRTGIDTAAGQQLRQLQLPEQEMFRYDRKLIYVCSIVLILWLGLVAVHAHYTESLLLSFRFAVDSLLKLLPLWLPALCGLFATLAARRLRVCSAKEIDGFRRRVEQATGRNCLRVFLSAASQARMLASLPSEQPVDTREPQGMSPVSPKSRSGLSSPLDPADRSSTVVDSRPFTVVCPAPGRLPIAAKVRIVCFDKTGTLTREEFSFVGCQPVEAASMLSFVSYEPDGPAMQMRPRGAGAPLPSVKNSPQTFQAAGGDRQVPPRLFEGLVCCHGLTLDNAQMVGTLLEQQMFESTGWKMKLTVFPQQRADGPTEIAGLTRLAFSPANAKGYYSDEDGDRTGGFVLLQRLVFDPVRQVMSVVVAKVKDERGGDQNEGEVFVFCKGSYEAIASLCRPETVPGQFLHRAGTYAKEGVYVLAAASKSLGVRTDLNAWKDLPRSEVESDLDLEGLLLFRNELRPDAADTIHQLKVAKIRPVILTGDSPLTAVAVARRAGMVGGSGGVFGSDTGRLQRLSRGDTVDGLHPMVLGDLVDDDLSGEDVETFQSGQDRVGDSRAGKRCTGGSQGWHPAKERTSAVCQGEKSKAAAGLCERVKWTNVDTGEEIDRWTVFFTKEYKELALTARAVEALTETPDILMAGDLSGEDFAVGDEGDSDQLEEESEGLLWSQGHSGVPPGSESTPSNTGGSSGTQSPSSASLGQTECWSPNSKRYGGPVEDPSSLFRVRQRRPTMFDRILFRVRVFARMSPHGKALIIERYQERGLIVSMVGDGTNDCFAIRQAQVGIAFGPGSLCQSIAPFAILTNQREEPTHSASSSDSSASAGQSKASLVVHHCPRANRFDSCGLLGVITLMREGRATLVTSFAVYKLQILYGLLSAVSYLMLTVGAYGTPNAFSLFFSSVAMLLGLSLSMLWSVPSVTPLTKRSPTSNPLGVRTVAEVMSILIVDLLALFLLFGLLYGPAGRPLPCAWVQREVRHELLQRQQIENLLDLHSFNEPHIAQMEDAVTHAKKKLVEYNPDKEADGGHTKQRTAVHDKAIAEVQRWRVEVTPSLSFPTHEANRVTDLVGNVSDKTISSQQQTLNGNNSTAMLKNLEETTKGHNGATAFLEVNQQVATRFRTEVNAVPFREKSIRKQSVFSSGLVEDVELRNMIPAAKRNRAVSHNGNAHEDGEVRHFSIPESSAQSWIEKTRGTAPPPHPDVDTLMGHNLRPGAAEHNLPCSRDGRTEASVIFLWLGACLLNAALIFSSGRTSGKAFWSNPVLMPLSFIFAVFFVFLVTAPKNRVSCVFMVNCPANEIRMQQQRRNAIGVAKQLVTDEEAKDMYRLLARNAEMDVVKVRAILSVDMAAPNERLPTLPSTSLPAHSNLGGASETSKSGQLETAGDLAKSFRARMARRAQIGIHGSRKPMIPGQFNGATEERNEGVNNVQVDEVQPKQGDRGRVKGSNGSVISAWYGQVLLYVLCSMSVLNGMIHMYVIGDQMGRDTIANWWRKAHPSRYKGEVIAV